ncbi:MAG: type II toxin-antitoxin system RelE/ParE family toxin [Spirochaetaceae bacterium]|jgi:toxin ParE1/3/4|nr:type II toxin-antitoxin system RelE/ParE family toxin [Spirochaetaceae bacterium]
MAKIIWTYPALEDLEKIAEYIALDNGGAANKLVQKIFHTVELLEEFPESGRIPPEFKRPQYREVFVDPCRIFYRIEKNKILILYVMRGEQKLKKYLLKERKRRN